MVWRRVRGERAPAIGILSPSLCRSSTLGDTGINFTSLESHSMTSCCDHTVIILRPRGLLRSWCVFTVERLLFNIYSAYISMARDLTQQKNQSWGACLVTLNTNKWIRRVARGFCVSKRNTWEMHLCNLGDDTFQSPEYFSPCFRLYIVFPPLHSPLHCCYSYTALNLSLSPYVSILGRVQVAVGDLPSNVLTSITNYLCLSAFGLVYPQAIAGVWY